jgi:glycerol-3-phosphate acyltransferase PlsY
VLVVEWVLPMPVPSQDKGGEGVGRCVGTLGSLLVPWLLLSAGYNAVTAVTLTSACSPSLAATLCVVPSRHYIIYVLCMNTTGSKFVCCV